MFGHSLLAEDSLAGQSNVKKEEVVETSLLNEVTIMFGENLNEAQGIEKDLLLAIGVDHTASYSPDEIKEIGIPFILKSGPRYWIAALEAGNYDLPVLVNNALILIYAKESNEETKKSALVLFRIAAEMNYWPAKFYIAEFNLENLLSADYGEQIQDMSIEDAELQRIASKTMEYYRDCAQRGFAPCQYRLGTWLATRQETAANGLKLLESAIKTSLNDSRYEQNFEKRRANAALILATVGKQFGYSKERISEFEGLVVHNPEGYIQ